MWTGRCRRPPAASYHSCLGVHVPTMSSSGLSTIPSASTSPGSERSSVGRDPAATMPPPRAAIQASRRASSRLRQVLGNETSYEAIMKYMRLSKAHVPGPASTRVVPAGDVRDDVSDAGSTVSATTRSHTLAQTKLNASIQTYTRRAQRELLPKIERLTNTTVSTTKLGQELAQTMAAELEASSSWAGVAAHTGPADSVDVFLFQTLCQNICRDEGRDAVLQYAVAAIDALEGAATSDEEDLADDARSVTPDPETSPRV